MSLYTKAFISAVTSSGGGAIELSEDFSAATFTRSLNGVSSFNGTMGNDIETQVKQQQMSIFRYWIRCEVAPAEFQYDKDIGWEGPLTFMGPNQSDMTINALDMSSHWSTCEVSNADYPQQDAARLGEKFLYDNILSDNALYLPEFRTVDAGALGVLNSVASDGRMVDAAIKDLTGLSYTFLGRRLYLFGQLSDPESHIHLNDEDWVLKPGLVQDATQYANRIVVKGTNVIGEASVTPDALIGRKTRRFDLPALKTQQEVDAAAQTQLAQMSGIQHIRPNAAITINPDISYEINDFIPGKLVTVDTQTLDGSIVEQFILNTVTFDCIGAGLSITLLPFNSGVASGQE